MVRLAQWDECSEMLVETQRKVFGGNQGINLGIQPERKFLQTVLDAIMNGF
jgi:hypothetical protein